MSPFKFVMLWPCILELIQLSTAYKPVIEFIILHRFQVMADY